MTTSEDLKADLIEGLKTIGLTKGENCYVSGNISSLARTKIKKNILLPTFLSSLNETIGELGTIFSPSASMNWVLLLNFLENFPNQLEHFIHFGQFQV